jgi:hypothetical protein
MDLENQNQIVLVSLNDLTTLMERTFTKCMEENTRENLADKQELKPLSYWLAKKNLDRYYGMAMGAGRQNQIHSNR